MTDPQHDIERVLLDAYHPDAKTRHTAIFALGKITDPRAYAVLLALLQDDEEWVVTAAAYMLGETGDTTLTPRLLMVFEQGTPPQQHALMSPLVKLDGVAMLPVLMPYLAHPIEGHRAAAVNALVSLEDAFVEALRHAPPDQQQGALPYLYAQFRVNHPLLQGTAAQALIAIGNEQTVAELVDTIAALEPAETYAPALVVTGIYGEHTVAAARVLLQHDNPCVREMGAWSVYHLHDAATVPLFCDLLRDPSIRVQFVALRALREFGDERGVSALVAFLHNPERRYPDETVFEALRGIGTPEALAIVATYRADNPPPPPPPPVTLSRADIIAGLQSNDRETCLHALSTAYGSSTVDEPIATLLMGLLTSDDPMRRRWVLACFQRDWSNPRFRDGLYTALSDPDRHLRGIAATYLADRGEVGAVEPLLALLNDPLCPTNVVLRALVKLNQPVPAEQVARFLNDETPSIRRAAAILLGRLGHPTAVETLLDGLPTEKDPTTRNAMLEALAHNHDARVVPALEGLLTHPAQEIRCAALAVVARMRPPSSWPLVAAALSERDGVVKMAAIAALGAYGDGRAVALLVPLLQTDNPAVQVGAAHALRAIGTPEALAAVERWHHERGDQL